MSTIRHTHRITIAQGDYRDAWHVTPPAGVDLDAWAREHVLARRGDGGAWGPWTITIAPIGARRT